MRTVISRPRLGDGKSMLQWYLVRVPPRRAQCLSTKFAPLSPVDQPAGTGFSYAPSNKYDHELPEVSLLFPHKCCVMTIPGVRPLRRVPPKFLQGIP